MNFTTDHKPRVAAPSVSNLCVFRDELKQLKTEKEELEKETERWKAEQANQRDKEREQYVVFANSLTICELECLSQSFSVFMIKGCPQIYTVRM